MLLYFCVLLSTYVVSFSLNYNSFFYCNTVIWNNSLDSLDELDFFIKLVIIEGILMKRKYKKYKKSELYLADRKSSRFVR